MRRRTDSLLAAVNALALTVATLFTGAWDASGHGHDPDAENAGRCTVDHEGGIDETAASTSRAAITGAGASHDHSCVACLLGRSRTTAAGKAVGPGPRDRLPAAQGTPSKSSPQTGERWQQAARGPPRA